MTENLDDKLDNSESNPNNKNTLSRSSGTEKEIIRKIPEYSMGKKSEGLIEFLIKSRIITSNPDIKREPSTIPQTTFGAGESPSAEDLRKAHRKVPTGEYHSPVEETQEKTDSPIDSDKYEIIEEAGRGRWGIVYKSRYKIKAKVSDSGLAIPAIEKFVAIKVLNMTEFAKEKIRERKIPGLETIFMNEVGNLKGANNVVSRYPDKDENGQLFLVMPYYPTFLSNILRDNDKEHGRAQFGIELEEKDVYTITRDILQGLKQAKHIFGQKVHGDIKPENIAVDGGLTLEKGTHITNGKKFLLNDFGTSTFESPIDGHNGRRDGMGEPYTRSPRLFIKEQDPRQTSDIFSIGSLAYRMFTGEYIFEEEINKHGSEFLAKEGLLDESGAINEKKLTKRIKSKVKGVPREYRSFVLRCLTSDLENTTKGYTSVNQAIDGLEKTQIPSFYRRNKKMLYAVQGTMLASIFLFENALKNMDTVPMELNSSYSRERPSDEIVRIKHGKIEYNLRSRDLILLDYNLNGQLDIDEADTAFYTMDIKGNIDFLEFEKDMSELDSARKEVENEIKKDLWSRTKIIIPINMEDKK